MSASEVVDNKKPVEQLVVAEKPVETDLSNMFNSETLSDIDILNPATNITYKYNIEINNIDKGLTKWFLLLQVNYLANCSQRMITKSFLK